MLSFIPCTWRLTSFESFACRVVIFMHSRLSRIVHVLLCCVFSWVCHGKRSSGNTSQPLSSLAANAQTETNPRNFSATLTRTQGSSQTCSCARLGAQQRLFFFPYSSCSTAQRIHCPYYSPDSLTLQHSPAELGFGTLSSTVTRTSLCRRLESDSMPSTYSEFLSSGPRFSCVVKAEIAT